MTTTEGHPNSMFVYKGDVVKEGETVTPTEIDDTILNAIPPQFNDVTLFYKTDNVEIDCLEYMTGVVLLISENDMYGLTFGCICEIFCCRGQILFVLDVMVTELFNEKFNSYEVSFRRGNLEVKEYTDLTYKWPLPVYLTDNGNLLIMNRATSTVLPY